MDPMLYRTEDGNFISFKWDVSKNEAASVAAGRPIFDKVLACSIMCPGSPKSTATFELERELSDGRVKRNEAKCHQYAQQIQAFKAQNASQEMTGTPLEQWPALDVRQAAELKALNIFTVEALADLPDTGLQRVGMGARQLQARAKAYLEAAKGNAGAEKLAAENESLKADVARLTAQVAELAARLDAEDSPKRGRRAAAE